MIVGFMIYLVVGWILIYLTKQLLPPLIREGKYRPGDGIGMRNCDLYAVILHLLVALLFFPCFLITSLILLIPGDGE